MSVAPLRQLERAARAALVRGLAMLMPTPRTGGPPDWSARPFRVLYLRYNQIGDMIMATGVIRAIASSHVTLTVDVLASPTNAAVLEGLAYVRHTVILDRRRLLPSMRTLWRIRRSGYDVVVDGMAAAPKPLSALVMLASRARYRIGIATARTRLYTVPAAPRPADRHIDYMAALSAPFGVDPAATDLRPELSLTASERAHAERHWLEAGGLSNHTGRGRRLLVNVSAGRPWRRWPDERFEAVVRSMRARHPGLAIAVIGDPGEAASVQRVAGACDGAAVRTPSVRDAFALVGTADVVFTPDTSISHAAAALGTPGVVMLPRHIADFAPYRGAGRNVFSDGEDVRSIAVEQVLDALEATFAESSTAGVRASS